MDSQHNDTTEANQGATTFPWVHMPHNLPISNVLVRAAFYSVPSRILPNDTAILCGRPISPSSPYYVPRSILESIGLTRLDAYWIITRRPMPVRIPLPQYPPAEHTYAGCAMCMKEDNLNAAAFICGFHFCLLVRAQTRDDLEVLAGLSTRDVHHGGIRYRDSRHLTSTLNRIIDLYVDSTPEYESTANQAAANAGAFGAIGDGRPAY
ncbi:hypothetical protein GL218_01858 [Daldinia childiae]|uniref:uncharacterized protein n=1 Tax=Daldinia childiae TaxID=326645 RepID=UPI001446FF58|nr:uncharacterized protein GL218_01858 [Daldinia childiae]KAF3064388.1 hypothetical protein GL218_01858 [Daldinia childiae]